MHASFSKHLKRPLEDVGGTGVSELERERERILVWTRRAERGERIEM